MEGSREPGGLAASGDALGCSNARARLHPRSGELVFVAGELGFGLALDLLSLARLLRADSGARGADTACGGEFKEPARAGRRDGAGGAWERATGEILEGGAGDSEAAKTEGAPPSGPSPAPRLPGPRTPAASESRRVRRRWR